jgi:serine protease Do
MQGLQFRSFVVGALASVAGIFGIAWMAGDGGSATARVPESLGAPEAPLSPELDVSALNDAYSNVAGAVLPSVVSISVTVERENKMFENVPENQRELYERFFGGGGDSERSYRSKGAGSGVIISADGYIVTNNHVIDGAVYGSEGIQVVLDDKRKFSAKVIGTDDLTDLAVIKIDANDLQAAHLGEMTEVEVGEIVFAVGNPLGLSGTVTSGIVSAIARGGMGGGGYSVSNYIQTDAAINPGNSGGGLFDINGSLVGINTAIATETGNYIGYGFAIPIDLTRAVISDLIEDGKIDRGYIGVAIKTIEDDVTAKGLGLDMITGVMVERVYKGSAGAQAGLEMGDVILEVDGREVSSSNELQSIVATYRANDNVELTVFRDGEKLMKTVKLKARDESSDTFAFSDIMGEEESDVSDISSFSFESLGMDVRDIDRDIKKELDLDHGVLVEDVVRYGIAYERKIFPGLVITQVDGQEIKNVSEFKDLLESKEPGDVMKVIAHYADRNGEVNQNLLFLEVPKM